MRKVDYILVGQGIAGSVLAASMLDRGWKILVVDSLRSDSASGVAAGICNPLVLKRFTKGWMADTTWPIALRFYTNLQEQLGIQFFNIVEIARVFSSFGEQNDWLARVNDAAYAPYVSAKQSEAVNASAILQVFGHGLVTAAGHLYAAQLVDAMRERLLQEDAFAEGSVEAESLSFSEESVLWMDVEARKIIFCDGMTSASRAWFEPLPFAPTKGELLKLRIPRLVLTEMIHAGVFLLPLGDDLYLSGSTFNRKEIDSNPSADGRKEILDRLAKFLLTPVEVVDHTAGIRPTTRDRRPFVGFVPTRNRVGILNGLGSRGGILAPWLAQMLCDNLESGAPINAEVDISKYYK